ncbi:membrane protein [Ruegeria sp. ANG-R]|nr:membrane protein [Ruegeria sp. ANG-R]
MVKALVTTVIVIALTLISQLGGLAWIIAMPFRRRVIAFILAYITLSVAAVWIAPKFGRVPLSCFDSGSLAMQSKMYCALNRNYVVPELKEALIDVSTAMSDKYTGTKTLVLDANFPFLKGFPLLPHLSHDDGEKVDLAFYYRDENAYLPSQTKSPIGYFAFEDGPTVCPKQTLTLRWDMAWLQGGWPDYQIDETRMKTVLQLLVADHRIGKVLVEPHLVEQLGTQNAKIRFQGCRAARHDDHIHIQL